MRRVLFALGAALLVTAALSACSRQQSALETTSSDSLLASNPMEQPSGNITPQSEYTEPQQEAPPPPAPKPAKPRPTRPASTSSSPSRPAASAGVRVEAGTPIAVSVATQISTETANVGDTWTGEVTENIIVGDRVVFPKGSLVSGVVTEAKPAKSGDRARLDLAVTSITVNGTRHDVDAGTESIEAGSTRARNLGAVAGGAAAGALIGKAVGGSGKGALIGGLIGGAAAGTAVAKSKGYQVVLKEGTTMTFSVKQPVTVRT